MNLLAAVLPLAMAAPPAGADQRQPAALNAEQIDIPAPQPPAPAAVTAVPLGPRPSTPRAACPSKPRTKRKAVIGATLGGAAATAVFMWVGAFIGADRLDQGNRSVGTVLPIPWVGPFIAASRTPRSDKERWGYVATGVNQLLSTAAMVAGAVGWARHRRFDRMQGRSGRIKSLSAAVMFSLGFGGTVAVYALTAKLGRASAPFGDDRYKRRLLIPWVGGIAAAPLARSYKAAAGLLTSSAVQLGASSLVVVGAVSLALRKRDKQRWTVVPTLDRTQAGLAATVQF